MYRQEFELLQSTHPEFEYIPVLSREAWGGKQGYVHDVYKGLCQSKPDALFFLCGWRAMIDEARKTILELGYDKKNIHFELYG